MELVADGELVVSTLLTEVGSFTSSWLAVIGEAVLLKAVLSDWSMGAGRAGLPLSPVAACLVAALLDAVCSVSVVDFLPMASLLSSRKAICLADWKALFLPSSLRFELLASFLLALSFRVELPFSADNLAGAWLSS